MPKCTRGNMYRSVFSPSSPSPAYTPPRYGTLTAAGAPSPTSIVGASALLVTISVAAGPPLPPPHRSWCSCGSCSPSSEFTLSGSFTPPCPFDVASTDASPPSTSHSTHPRGRSPRLRRTRSNRRARGRRSIGRRSIGWWAGRGKASDEGERKNEKEGWTHVIKYILSADAVECRVA
ncbi:hypothetical protein B0H14DRAFT_3034681, partial [Mycena olivaceomarginata]